MGRPVTPIAVRFWRKVNKSGPIPAHRPELGACWVWTGAPNESGYGSISEYIANRHVAYYVHRFAYVTLVRAIPEGWEVDHLCFVRHCVNPAHLEAVTRKENLRRMAERSAAVRHLRAPVLRTVCRAGLHELTGENVLVSGEDRRCKECRNEWKRQARRQGRAA